MGMIPIIIRKQGKNKSLNLRIFQFLSQVKLKHHYLILQKILRIYLNLITLPYLNYRSKILLKLNYNSSKLSILIRTTKKRKSETRKRTKRRVKKIRNNSKCNRLINQKVHPQVRLLCQLSWLKKLHQQQKQRKKPFSRNHQ